MAIIRWDPGTDVQAIRSDFDRMVREMNRMFGNMFPVNSMAINQTGSDLCPPISVYQTHNEILIECELPGLEQKDVEVTTTRDSITISGEFKHRENLSEQDLLLNERTFGRFTRTLNLPEHINFEQTHASFRNGLLTITAPLAEEAQRKPRKIQIEG